MVMEPTTAEAAERDAREREIADELAAVRRRQTSVKQAILAGVVAAASAVAGTVAIAARR